MDRYEQDPRARDPVFEENPEQAASDEQIAYLEKLAADVGIDVETEGLTRADATRKIDELRAKAQIGMGEAG
jgi:hypothetical protein